MNDHFAPVCLPEKQRVLLYFGVVLECDYPILEAVFYTSFANTATTSAEIIEWGVIADLTMVHLGEKIEGRVKTDFPALCERDGFFWTLDKGILRLQPGRVNHSLRITIEPEYPSLFLYPLPYFTVHFFGYVLYSIEHHTFCHIPFNEFDALVDFHIDRLVKLLE